MGLNSDLLTLKSDKIVLQKVSLNDVSFLLELLNDPDFITNIGDRGVRTKEQTQAYLEKGVLNQPDYLGLWAIRAADDGYPMGVISVLKRDFLEHIDLGYALLRNARGQGVARCAAFLMLSYLTGKKGVGIVDAIVNPNNQASINLLLKLNFVDIGYVLNPEHERLKLYRYLND
ncbi:N-acetyltransferase [Pseudidiomarina gelatinasegens]|uniref:N-acetyltransferase n=1 Tax=Pseudidiomarina gelatinasegens TaxID=2487740 RepID=A0A443Z4M7_9GAMM|nr:GNAT family N-acetyltransferase [Pseudidiomarina gelatinasegens]RWU11620.1 N-acetyltransferase [Pseudidiomarina gelatinasegens]|tara:strand:+ start:1195 stop:1716 length:522 start_codon:yes stop_codon:yes gene_type:complete